MKRTQPLIFIDTVGGDNFNYKDRKAVGHETFPALRDVIASGYRLARDIDGTRIYVRQDRP